MFQLIITTLIKYVVESLVGVFKELYVTPVKTTVSETQANIPPIYDRIGAARMVDAFHDYKLQSDSRT